MWIGGQDERAASGILCRGCRQAEVGFEHALKPDPGDSDITQIQIDTGDAVPVDQHPHKLPDKLRDGVRKEVRQLEERRIIMPSTSPWASHIVPVVKPDGTVRVCVDYRRLNSLTTPHNRYMPTLQEILERAGNAVE